MKDLFRFLIAVSLIVVSPIDISFFIANPIPKSRFGSELTSLLTVILIILSILNISMVISMSIPNHRWYSRVASFQMLTTLVVPKSDLVVSFKVSLAIIQQLV
jgi:hypothetical protein